MIRKLLFAIVTLVLSIGLISCSTTEKEQPTMNSEQMMDLVQRAAALIEKEGTRAFPQFRDVNGGWRNGNTYVFVWDCSTKIRVVYPPNPQQGEGVNVTNIRDSHGRPIGKIFLNTVLSPPYSGWIYYQWPEPNSVIPVWKSTFVERAVSPSGTKYLVGSGMYIPNDQKSRFIRVVDDIVASLKKLGVDALEMLKQEHKYDIMGGTAFVANNKGDKVSGTVFPHFKKYDDDHAKSEKEILNKCIDATKEKDSAWVEHKHKLSSDDSAKTLSIHVKKVDVDGKEYIVGASSYLD